MNISNPFTIGKQRNEPRRRQPRQARAQQTVDAFFKAAAQILETHGESGLSTNKVAERSGLSIGTLYQYFPNKEHLVAAMAARGRAMLMAKLEAHLAAQAADPLIRQRDPRQILRECIAIFLDGCARGKTTEAGVVFGRALVRLAWTWEKPEDTAVVASQSAARLQFFFETIRHSELPPPNMVQIFVVVRGVMAVLRYLSLAKSPLLDSADLPDQLTQLAWSMFVGSAEEPVSQGMPNAGSDTHPTSYLDSLSQALSACLDPAENADFPEVLESENVTPLRRKPTQKRAEQTIDTIYRSLVQVLEAEGDEGMTTSKVAKQSGFSIGTLYQYFPDKKRLVRAASLYGISLLYKRLDAYLTAVEADQEAARLLSHRKYLREAATLYVNGLYPGAGHVKGQFFSGPLVRLACLWENPQDTNLMAEQAAARIVAFWERIQHPGYPESVNPFTILLVNFALVGVVRSAILESSPLVGSKALGDALVQMVAVMHTGKL